MGFLRSQLLKVVDWADSSTNTMVYKFPMDGREIMYGSKLTVRESQVAVFVNKGQIADVFTPGMYALKTSNLPILTKLCSWPYGFKSPFFADVYFINTKQFTNQKWGTTNPITLRDKEFGPIRIKGYGTYAFKVDNAEIFLKELFGTNSMFTTENIASYLKSILVSNISDTIAESKVSALDLACNLLEFNAKVEQVVKQTFSDIGLKLTKLIIENISFPEAVEKAIDTRTSMGVLGDKMDTFVKYQTANAIADSAKNPGSMNSTMGIGTGLAMGEVMKSALTQSDKKPEAEGKVCPKCGAHARANAKFCPECGQTLVPSKKNCAKCGAEIGARAKFCPECGASQQTKRVCPKCNTEVPSGKFCPNCGTKI